MKYCFSFSGRIVSSVLVLCCALSACSITHQDVKARYDQKQAEYEQASLDQSRQQDVQQAPLVLVNAPFLSSRTLPLALDARLPEPFQRASSFERSRDGRGFSLPEVADMITKRYGIRVRIRPDVFLPASSLVMGGAQVDEGTDAGIGIAASTANASSITAGGGVNPAAPLARLNTLSGPSVAAQSAVSVKNFGTTIDFDFTGSLTEYLHRISAFMGISSEWDAAAQELVFYRLVTKTFSLDTTPGKTTSNSVVNKGSSLTGSGSSATGTAGVTQSSESDTWDSVEKTLKAIKSKAGSVIVNRGTRTITLVDTQEVVNAASKYLDHQNAVLGRQVLLSVKLIRVALNRQADSGIDFGLAFKNFVNGAATWGLGSSAGSSIASNLGGNLTYTVLDSTRSTAGSTMVAKFVSDFGQIVDEYSQDIPVRNNRTVPLMDYTSQSYLSKTTPGSGENGVPGLETSTILSGTLFSITPSIKDNESLVLSLGLDRTNDPILTSISTGEGRTFQQVQLVNQRGIKLDTEIGIKNRETLIIMGINKDSYSDDNRWGISGVSKALSGNRELQFIIISPRIISGS